MLTVAAGLASFALHHPVRAPSRVRLAGGISSVGSYVRLAQYETILSRPTSLLTLLAWMLKSFPSGGDPRSSPESRTFSK